MSDDPLRLRGEPLPLIDFPTRVFQVWAYSVGMSRLLLRSTRSDAYGTRVDVLFQGMRAMKVLTRFPGLVVWDAGDRKQVEITEATGLIPDDETRFFALSSGSLTGYVVAGVCVHAEDEGEYFHPSELWPDR